MARYLGVPAAAPVPGEHMSGVCFGADGRDAILLPYLRTGLRDGDRCVVVLDSADIPGLRAHLDDPVRTGQLLLCDSAGTYLHDGAFHPDRMTAFWEEQAACAARDGYTFTRIVGDMSWMAQAEPDRALLVAYEQRAQRFAPRHPQSLLSLYDVSRLGATVLVDLIRTRATLLVGGTVLENPHRLSREEFLAVAGR